MSNSTKAIRAVMFIIGAVMYLALIAVVIVVVLKAAEVI